MYGAQNNLISYHLAVFQFGMCCSLQLDGSLPPPLSRQYYFVFSKFVVVCTLRKGENHEELQERWICEVFLCCKDLISHVCCSAYNNGNLNLTQKVDTIELDHVIIYKWPLKFNLWNVLMEFNLENFLPWKLPSIWYIASWFSHHLET